MFLLFKRYALYVNMCANMRYLYDVCYRLFQSLSIYAVSFYTHFSLELG